jgi:hypothetical protein
VSFRIGQNDVEALSRYFQPSFDGDDLLRVPNYNAIVRTLVNGVPTQSFSMATLPPLGNPNPGLSDALKQLSAAKYGKPRAVVEKTIFGRLATQTPEPKPFQSPFNAPGQAPANRPGFDNTPAPGGISTPPPKPPSSGGSFLDEWLAKQRASAPAPMVSPARSALPPNAPQQPAFTAPVVDTGPHAKHDPALDAIQDGGNVSSAQLDQKEISDIADELKKNLYPAAPKLGVEPESAALPVEPAPIETPPSPTEGTLHLKPKTQTDSSTPDDTIFIDSEGQFHLRETAGDTAPKE